MLREDKPMNICDCCDCAGDEIRIEEVISILPNDYSAMENKPTVNGIVLSGEQTGKDLKLLSILEEDYDDSSLDEVQADEGYFVAIGKGKQHKVPASDIKNIKVNEELETKVPNGTIQYVIIKKGE